MIDFFLPPDWENLRHVLQWLEETAQTIHKICPAGCEASWPMRRWPSRNSEP